MHKVRILSILFFTLLSTGCAHKRLVEAGEDLNRQGRYELAVEKYKEALSIKPDDRKTQQNLAFAQEQLDYWLEGVLAQAHAAKAQGLNGRAMLLYAKVAQLSRNNDALNHYKQLRKKLADEVSYKIALQKPVEISDRLGRDLHNIQLITKANSSKSNEFSARLSFTEPKFSTRSSTKAVTQQYVSGTETIANPDYLHLQQDISIDRENIAEYVDKVGHQRDTVKTHNNAVTSLRKDREIAQLRMDKAAAGSSEYNRWKNEVTRLNGEIAKAEQSLTTQKNELSQLESKLSEYQTLLQQHLNELSYIYPTVEQDVYSDYVFDVKQITKVASGNLTVTFKSGPTKHKGVTVKVSDETHEAHPLVELTRNPLELPNKAQMTSRYREQVVIEAESLITAHAKDYREKLRNNASQQNGIDEQLEGYIRYGLSGSEGVDSQSERTMRRMLEQEFGVTGEFSVNKLLHLYRY